jgi:hypothetical protein
MFRPEIGSKIALLPSRSGLTTTDTVPVVSMASTIVAAKLAAFAICQHGTSISDTNVSGCGNPSGRTRGMNPDCTGLFAGPQANWILPSKTV